MRLYKTIIDKEEIHSLAFLTGAGAYLGPGDGRAGNDFPVPVQLGVWIKLFYNLLS